MLAGANVRLTADLSYAWADPASGGKSSPQYWLEDIDLHGKSTWHGPISPLPVDKLPAQAAALLLSHLFSPAQPTSQSVVSRVLPAAGNIKGGALGGAKGSSGMAVSSLQAQWDIAAIPGVKLLVGQAGWYRVTQPELVAAGLDDARDPRLLKLFVDGQEIPLAVNSVLSGRLEAPDSIEFYGQGLDTVGTDLRTSDLLSGTTPGLRLQLSSNLNGAPTQAQSFPLTIERKHRAVYFTGLKADDRSGSELAFN